MTRRYDIYGALTWIGNGRWEWPDCWPPLGNAAQTWCSPLPSTRNCFGECFIIDCSSALLQSCCPFHLLWRSTQIRRPVAKCWSTCTVLTAFFLFFHPQQIYSILAARSTVPFVSGSPTALMRRSWLAGFFTRLLVLTRAENAETTLVLLLRFPTNLLITMEAGLELRVQWHRRQRGGQERRLSPIRRIVILFRRRRCEGHWRFSNLHRCEDDIWYDVLHIYGLWNCYNTTIFFPEYISVCPFRNRSCWK